MQFRIMPLGRLTAAIAAAVLSITAGNAAPRLDWNQTVAVTAEGNHLVGNPEAQAKLVEYVSYTCSHCAHFEEEANSTLSLGFIGSGKGSVEYRSFIRNSIDIAASLVARCGPSSKFRANHTLLMRGQSKWFRAPTQGESQRWANPDFPTAMRAIAQDLGFYEMMEPRGYTRHQLDTCLADKATASKLAAQTRKAMEVEGVTGTPSFLLNGELRGEHAWDELRPLLALATR